MTPEEERSLGDARDKLWAERRSDPDVHGIAIGRRTKAGEKVDELTVIVYVGKKRPPAHLSSRRLLPKTVVVPSGTWGVDVIQAGPFKALAQIECPTQPVDGAIREWMRPALQGASVSNFNDPTAGGVIAGTLGCYVMDNETDDICILSNNHVIGALSNGNTGDPIIQPGGYDSCPPSASNEFARLTRKVEMRDNISVDAAIARLNNQNSYSERVAHDLMPPISPRHPMVGMFTAGDAFGFAFLTRIDATFAALNIRPLFADPPAPGTHVTRGIVAPVEGMKIEKVGRTTGYTSMPIMAVGAYAKIEYETDLIEVQDMFATIFLGTHGDSGSVACLGGDGETPAPSRYYVSAVCAAAQPISTYYDIPLDNDEALQDDLRDNFLMMSKVGRLLVTTTYVNTPNLRQRLEQRTGSDSQEVEQAYAQSYYSKYHDFVADVLTDPVGDAIVTQENLDDVYAIYQGEYLLGMLTAAEFSALETIYNDMLRHTLGMNRAQVIDYFNETASYETVRAALATVPTIEDAPVLPQTL